MEELRKNDKSLESLFDVTLSYQNASLVKKTDRFSYEVRWHSSMSQVNNLDVHVNDREGNGIFVWDCDYLKSLFGRRDIKEISDQVHCLIADAIKDPYKKVKELCGIPPEQEKKLIGLLKGIEPPPPRALTLARLFERRVAESPDSVALVSGSAYLTARELDIRANGIAHRLKKSGVGNESIVIVMTKRSPVLFAALLGVLKAGAAFLPLDPGTPIDRAKFTAEKSGAAAVIAGKEYRRYFDGVKTFFSEEEIAAIPAAELPPETECSLSSLAYIIFTSGTTGVPKGVMIENHTICGFIEKLGRVMDFSPGMNTLCAASIAFDIFIMESFPPLMHGGTVVLAGDGDMRIPENLSRLIKEHNVNSLMFMPSRMQLLLAGGLGDSLKGIKQIMLGGEALTENLTKKLRAYTGAEIFNFYGPTEATIAATYKKIDGVSKITIGRPMRGVQAYILAPDGSLAVRGTGGELAITGDCLARGYIGDEEKTAAVFVPDPFNPNKKVYLTGDLVRLTDNSEIDYIGRRDNQVKIRGYRIELDGIKARIAAIPGISDCAVAALDDEARGKYLCAYICGEKIPPHQEIRAALSRTLPHYMIPSYFVELPALPVTQGGKLDVKALPMPTANGNASSAQESFFTRTEYLLAGIWEQILKTRPARREDNFFELGGDSMSIITVASTVTRDFGADIPLNRVYENPTLSGYAALIDSVSPENYRSVTRVRYMPDYPVSSAQRRMYMLISLEGPSIAYNMPGAFRIKGKFDKRRFEWAFKEVIKINGSLRTGFFMKNGVLRQKIHTNVNFAVGTHECGEAELKGLLKSFVRPFDISRPPLARAECIKLGKNDHAVFVDMHHIIADGISAELLFNQISKLYSGEEVTPCGLRYADYSVWQKDYLASDEVKRQRDYWLNSLSGELPQLELRTDYPRKTRQSFTGKREEFAFSQELREGIQNYAASRGVTVHTVMLGAFYILLSRYSGGEDIIVGIPTAGRSRTEFQDIAGMFVNTLALRARPEAAKRCADFISEIGKSVVGGMINQDYPFEMLVSDLKIPRDLARNPLFDVFFAYGTAAPSLKIKFAEVKEITVGGSTSKFDITFDIQDAPDGLRWNIEYSDSLYSADTIAGMAGHYLNILRSITGGGDKNLCELDMLAPDDKEQLINRMRGIFRKLPEGSSFESVLLKNAKENPYGTAVVFGYRKVSFSDFTSKAVRFAGLLKSKGVGAGSVVAVSLPRSLEMAAAVVGVLLPGGAYLPVDPEYPPDRIAYMLEDSGAALAISDRGLPIETITPEQAFDDSLPEDISAPIPADNSPAYLIYTSGSTGKPKGVCVTRANLLNYCEACGEHNIFKSGSISVSVTTISFDIFVLEFLVSLYFGAGAAIADSEQQRVPALLAEFMKACKADFIQFTPSRLLLMLEDAAFRSALGGIKTLVCGGEAMTEELLARIQSLTRARIINFYGPTETTVYSTLKDLTNSRKVTIGKPVLNTGLYILDKAGNLVPEGVIGELYIGGDGVAAGYHNRPELTAERFLPDPFRGEGRMYRTGDLAHLLPNDEIVCLGRADDQIKFGGHRIEPGEIEKAIFTIPEVTKAIVVVKRVSGADKLCAYYISSAEIKADDIRVQLKKTLSSYMIPSYFVRIERMPMTPSGKVDRRALPPIYIVTEERRQEAEIPMTEIERAVAKIWTKVLGVKSLAPDDDFFFLGGDSAAVIRAQIELMKLGMQIKTQDFYENPTVRGLCAYIAAGKSAPPAPPPVNYPAKIPPQTFGSFPLKRVLLAGATGYLGAHVLKELIGLGAEVACIVRGRSETEARERLKKTLAFYFGSEAEEIMRRVTIIGGDLSAETEAPDFVFDTAINCAAETRHFGDEKLFFSANVASVANLIKLCKANNAALCHISTTSVAGSAAQAGKNTFTEEDFDIGQNYGDNPYVKSKFLAEALIFEEVLCGLKAKIMRVGNLMPRYSDGVFQINPEKNAFFNRLRALKLLGAAPQSLIGQGAEFTPVDLCARAVILLAGSDGGFMYHIFNPNEAAGTDVIGALNASGSPIEELSDTAFGEKVIETVRSGSAQDLGGIIEDLAQPAVRGAAVEITCSKTVAALKKAGFEWNKPDREYLMRALDKV